MKKILFVFLISLPIYCIGQETTSKRYSIRSGLIFNYSTKHYNLNSILCGFSKFDRKNNLHIIELQQLNISKHGFDYYDGIHNQTINVEESKFKISLCYQYEYFINKIESKIRPYVGSSLDIGLSRLATTISPSLSYPKTETEFSPQLKLNFGLNINLIKDLYLDFYLPVDFVSYDLNSNYSDNPNIREDLRRSKESEIKIFPFDYFSLRLILGLKF